MYNLQKIDELVLSDYFNLSEGDECYYFGEYASRKGYQHSVLNRLLFNFKKPVTRKENSQEWQYKEDAIREVSNILLSCKLWNKLKTATWVPIPPSKTKVDLQYDDRLMDVLHILKNGYKNLDVREILNSKCSRKEAHLSKVRPTVQYHENNFIFTDALINPTPNTIIIFDDLITTGASFKAAKNLLQKKFQNSRIVGLFIARATRVLFEN